MKELNAAAKEMYAYLLKNQPVDDEEIAKALASLSSGQRAKAIRDLRKHNHFVTLVSPRYIPAELTPWQEHTVKVAKATNKSIRILQAVAYLESGRNQWGGKPYVFETPETQVLALCRLLRDKYSMYINNSASDKQILAEIYHFMLYETRAYTPTFIVHALAWLYCIVATGATEELDDWHENIENIIYDLEQ